MCFDDDARPPLPPIRGGAIDARDVRLTSADGTDFAAYAARADAPSGAGIVIIPDVRGLHPYYEELTLRFAEAGVHAVAIDFYARTAGAEKRSAGFEYEPHVLAARPGGVDRRRRRGRRLPALRRGRRGRAPLHRRLLHRRSDQPAPGRGSGLDLSGVIGFYPWPVGPHRSGLPAPADEAPRFGCPVLAIYGGADAGIPAEAREAFDRALEAAGVEHRTVVYEDAPHSFFDRKSEFAEASAAAWDEVLRFMGVSA